MTSQNLISKKLHKKPHGKQPENKEQNADKKDKPVREPLFVPPANWREEVRISTTLQTAVPQSQEKFLKENKPNFLDVKKRQDIIISQQAKVKKEIQEINLKIKKINNETQFRMEEIKTEMKTLRESLAPKLQQSKDLKAHKEQNQKKLDTLKQQMDQLTKEFYLKRKWTRESLLEKIEDTEEEMRNKRINAQEERQYNSELKKMRDTLTKMDQFEEIAHEYVVIKNGLKGINVKELSTELREKFNRLNILQEEYGNLKKQKTSMNEEQAKSKNITDEESKLLKTKDQLQKNIDELRSEHQKVFEMFQQQIENFQRIQYEEERRNFILKLQRDLKNQEKKKQFEEEKLKRQQGLIEREKSKINFLYNDETLKCNQIMTFLQNQLSIQQQGSAEEVVQEEERVEAIDGMQVLNKKQNIKVQSKSKQDKKKKQKSETNTDGKVHLSLQILQDMYQLKITPPIKIDQVQDTLQAIKAKIEGYETLKQKALEEFNPEQALKNIQEEEENEDEQERTEDQKTNKKQKNSKQSRRAVGMEEFPEL